MSLRSKRTRIYLAIAIVIALGFLVPPSINLNRFRAKLSESLSRSLGRQVSVQDVRLRLLPLPGFTFRQLRISDDEFSAEPILQTGDENGVATLRISSLWRGRLEIASVSLTQASLNLVRDASGHWNMERLVNRAAQVPTAPTARKKPEWRPRFPYIEITESRINFKFGPEKKPFALSDAQFALWLAAENRWNVRLKAIPLRTDESVTDTGTIKISGSFDRASEFAKTPFHFQFTWEQPEVNAIAQIVHGHDPGWRGAVDLNAELKGTPADFATRLNADIEEFRRYDIARSTPFNLHINCEQRFRANIVETSAKDQLDFDCKAPLGSGVLNAQGELHPLGTASEYSARLVASEVPLASLVRMALHAKSTLPSDLNADGTLDGSWTIEGSAGSPTIWNGTFTATNAVVRSHVLEHALLFPRKVVVNFEPAQNTNLTVRHAEVTIPYSRAVLEPVALDLGGDATLSAAIDPSEYSIELHGNVNWQRLTQIARCVGLHPPSADLRGSGEIDARYSGEWRHFAAPTVSAQAQIHTATVALRGFSEPLHVRGGTFTFDGDSFAAQGLQASFPHAKLELVASISGSHKCERYLACNLDFTLQADQLREAAVREVLSVPSSGMNLPFFSSGRQFEAKWLLDMPSSGTISVQHLSLAKIHAGNASAQLEVASGTVLVKRWTADVFGGKSSGEWAFDFSGKAPAIKAQGSLRHVHADQLEHAPSEDHASGYVDVNYRLSMSGSNADALTSSLAGSGNFLWHNGSIPASAADQEAPSVLSFGLWSGQFALGKQRVTFESTKMLSPSGVREVNGEIALNRALNLRLVKSQGAGVLASESSPKPGAAREQAKLDQSR
ncbi:MAG TPA: AsmA family protein [Terriglobales bacterium]|nr:AsmA family protein [Terriglobales bacterium]